MAVGFADLKRELDSFVAMGRWAYLERAHKTMSGADTYFILWRSMRCDMKAVVSMATGEELGNSQMVAATVKDLGFIVVDQDGNPRK